MTLQRDPGLRIPLWKHPINKQDEIRRAYLHIDFSRDKLKQMAKLSDLPYDMLANIAKRLNKLEDFTSFTSVSKSLCASAIQEYFEGLWLRQQTPYLMLPIREEDGNDDGVRELYSLVDGESIVASTKFAKFRKKKCLESLGWLLVSQEDGSMSLLEPFSGTEIPLPHQNTFPGYDMVELDTLIFFRKMVLSARPSETSAFVLMVIGGGLGHLGYWRLGDKAWNRIEDRKGSFEDVVYYGGGQFYALGHPGMVWVFNLSQSDNQLIEGRVVTQFVPKNWAFTRPSHQSTNPLVDFKRIYLVKTIDDSLLIITRTTDLNSDCSSRITSKFQVYEVDTAMGTFDEIYYLGSMAVFIGHNSTIGVDASRFPGTVIKANHIYFTDDDWRTYYLEYDGPNAGGGVDCGVYNMETGSIEAAYPGEPLLSKVSPSTWISPCF